MLSTPSTANTTSTTLETTTTKPSTATVKPTSPSSTSPETLPQAEVAEKYRQQLRDATVVIHAKDTTGQWYPKLNGVAVNIDGQVMITTAAHGFDEIKTRRQPSAQSGVATITPQLGEYGLFAPGVTPDANTIPLAQIHNIALSTAQGSDSALLNITGAGSLKNHALPASGLNASAHSQKAFVFAVTGKNTPLSLEGRLFEGTFRQRTDNEPVRIVGVPNVLHSTENYPDSTAGSSGGGVILADGSYCAGIRYILTSEARGDSPYNARYYNESVQGQAGDNQSVIQFNAALPQELPRLVVAANKPPTPLPTPTSTPLPTTSVPGHLITD